MRGVIAAIASDNAKEGGHLVPTIAFGVPAGASMALLLSAFLIHGLVPGPEMLTKHLDVTYSIIWTLTLSHVMGAVICIAASGWFARLATVLHDDLRQVGHFVRIHSQASMRCGGAEALDIARAVDVVVGIVEEDLHDLHGIPWISRAFRFFPLGPVRLRRRAPGS